MTNVSFIVLNYNDHKTTQRLIDSLVSWPSNELDLHFVVVDNHSSDDSFPALQKLYQHTPRVDVIMTDHNGGYSYGNNYGTKYARKKYASTYIVIANPDIQIDYITFTELLKTFEEAPDIAMVAPVMKDLNGNYRIATQSLPKYSDDLRMCFTDKNPPSVNTTNPSYLHDDKRFVLTEMIPGSFFVVRSGYYEEVGLLDENVFLFCEERIIGNKLKQNGYILVIRSDLFFIHAHSVSIRKAMKIIQSEKILLKSRYYYEKKYNKCNGLQLAIYKTSSIAYLLKLRLLLSIGPLLKRKKR